MELASHLSNLRRISLSLMDLPVLSLFSKPKTSSSLMLTLSSVCGVGFLVTDVRDFSTAYKLLNWFDIT